MGLLRWFVWVWAVVLVLRVCGFTISAFLDACCFVVLCFRLLWWFVSVGCFVVLSAFAVG